MGLDLSLALPSLALTRTLASRKDVHDNKSNNGNTRCWNGGFTCENDVVINRRRREDSSGINSIMMTRGFDMLIVIVLSLVSYVFGSIYFCACKHRPSPELHLSTTHKNCLGDIKVRHSRLTNPWYPFKGVWI
ncbi:hypothetical protein T492DRAFT_1052146 [Pavlovales sp. CCMP2436]|nr:hypothetical protein T492DRAFT_1052146 [Pavlovales sp. CCMP2436]